MLTEAEIELIRDTARIVSQQEVPVTNNFYARLFKAEPDVRPLFPEDMFEQADKLWDSIVMVVESIDDLAAITPTLRRLGRQHAAFGATPALYAALNQTLIETLEGACGAEWRPDHHAAWDRALSEICAIMMAGAEDRAA